MSIDPETAEKISTRTAATISAAMRDWIDKQHAETGMDRHELSSLVGKALMIQGASFIGASVGLQPHVPIEIARTALNTFKAFIAARKRGTHKTEDWLI